MNRTPWKPSEIISHVQVHCEARNSRFPGVRPGPSRPNVFLHRQAIATRCWIESMRGRGRRNGNNSRFRETPMPVLVAPGGADLDNESDSDLQEKRDKAKDDEWRLYNLNIRTPRENRAGISKALTIRLPDRKFEKPSSHHLRNQIERRSGFPGVNRMRSD
jgi:hypothetical protein